MLSEDKYFKTMTEDELWQRYCGFLDLSIEEFMETQKEILMDEIKLVANSFLGKKIMGGQEPKSVDEFREMVPLTTYDDYEPYLTERREDVLAEKPTLWCHSSGKGGAFKWIPHGSEFPEQLAKAFLCILILAVAKKKGQVGISPGMRGLFVVAPPPYASGFIIQALAQCFSFQPIPPLETIETMEFPDRIKAGFRMALRDGVDVMAGLTSVLFKMGESMSEQAQGMKFSPSMLHPKIVLRLLRALLLSKKAKRAILPKDMWPVKAILASGVDTPIYKDGVRDYWGKEPYEFYGGSETFLVGLQDWNRKGMVFYPYCAFLEFIPYEETLKQQADEDYRPTTVLLNEVEEGRLYEVVVTQFYGMPLLRYRLRDVVKFISLRDSEAGVDLPHFYFQRRVGETINIGGIADLDEKTIWQALVNTKLKFADWTACKESEHNQSILRLYFELEEDREIGDVEILIDEQLKVVDVDYRDIDSYLNLQPVRVTLLSPGTFQRYTEERRKEGADLAHLKPKHVNASEAIIQRLIQLSEINRT